ncbi:MAG: hypothetical protein EOQ44_32270 [Mesorhizobium sp.]|nr:MAG: hypothetical protein EOQ44_32270 [Mesorhizobium sp.]RWP30378.1 MAG: hypothetical protein EOR02_13565 [Mesorhizobium sp.]TIP07586.1 MAG: hypothetical protein E5X73_36160 [Mesorhizobium sp.]
MLCRPRPLVSSDRTAAARDRRRSAYRIPRSREHTPCSGSCRLNLRISLTRGFAIQMTLTERIPLVETRIPLKFAMRHLAGAVSVVTAGIGDERTGATVTTAHSLSVDPEVMVVSINQLVDMGSHQPASAVLRQRASSRPDGDRRAVRRTRWPEGFGSFTKEPVGQLWRPAHWYFKTRSPRSIARSRTRLCATATWSSSAASGMWSAESRVRL